MRSPHGEGQCGNTICRVGCTARGVERTDSGVHRGVLNMILVIFSSVKRVGAPLGDTQPVVEDIMPKSSLFVILCSIRYLKVRIQVGLGLVKDIGILLPHPELPTIRSVWRGRPTMVEKTARGGSSPSNAHWSIVDHQRLSVTIHVEKVLFPKKGTQLCISNSQAGLSGIMGCLTHKTHNFVKYYNIEYLQHFNEVPQPRYCLMPINLISGYRHPQSDK